MKNKNRYSIMIAFVLVAILSVQGVLAINGFRANSVVFDSTNTTRNYMRISYVEENFYSTGLFGIPFKHEIDNYVPKGQPYETYITYGLEPLNDWNSRYPNSRIDYCTIIINDYRLINTAGGGQDWGVITSLNRTFTTNDVAVTKEQFRHFLILNKGEFARVFFDCHFAGTNLTIDTPTSLKITAPTFECKACQYYEEFQKSFDEIVGDAIDTYSQRITQNNNMFVGWNFDIITTAFWIVQIVVVLAIIGMIFLGLYWIYRFLKNLVERWAK